MKAKVFVIALAATLALGGIAEVSAQTEAKPSTIAVSGEAKISVDPDMASLTFGVEQTARQPKDVQELVVKAADSIISAMLQSGISKPDIKTGYFSVYPVYSDKEGQANKITGYRGSSSIIVTLRDITQMGAIVEKGMSAGANKVENLRYLKGAESELRDEALGKAVAAAMDKAKAIAAALGRPLGKALSVDNVQVSSDLPDESAALIKMAAPQPNGFSPGRLEISASLSILFELD